MKICELKASPFRRKEKRNFFSKKVALPALILLQSAVLQEARERQMKYD